MNLLHLLMLFVLSGKGFEGHFEFTHEIINADKSPEIGPVMQDMLNGSRKGYIYNNCLIDVATQSAYQDNTFTGKDTVGYLYHDFQRKKFIKFDKLSVNAAVLDSGELSRSAGFDISENDDPLKDWEESMLRFTDTVVNSHNYIVVTINTAQSDEEPEVLNMLSTVRFWVDPDVKDFPVQLSFRLSRMTKNGFVFKRELPLSAGGAIMVEEFTFRPGKLSDPLVSVFRKWDKLLSSGN